MTSVSRLFFPQEQESPAGDEDSVRLLCPAAETELVWWNRSVTVMKLSVTAGVSVR